MINKIKNLNKSIKDALFLSDDMVNSFIKTAPHRYKLYEIKKRNSEEKRKIAHPSKELKVIQGIITNELEKHLPVHDCAYAYRRKIGIKENALAHKNSNFLLKMDISNFFNSITPDIFFKKIIKLNIGLTEIVTLFTMLLWK